MVDPEDSGFQFCNTSSKVEVTKGYSIRGIKPIEHKGKEYLPTSAQLVFRDGDCTKLVISGKLIRRGEVTDELFALPDLYTTNQVGWPEWLHRLNKLAHSELQATMVRA